MYRELFRHKRGRVGSVLVEGALEVEPGREEKM
jgi:hypothetical protein